MGRPLERSDCDELEHYIRQQNAICSRNLLEALNANHGIPSNDNPPPFRNTEPDWWPSMWFGDLVSGRPFTPIGLTIASVLDAVSSHYGIPKLEIISQRRTLSIVRPRQVCYYLAKHMTAKSLPEIGRRLGDRDHTSILSGIRKIEHLRSTDSKIDSDVRAIASSLGGSLA